MSGEVVLIPWFRDFLPAGGYVVMTIRGRVHFAVYEPANHPIFDGGPAGPIDDVAFVAGPIHVQNESGWPEPMDVFRMNRGMTG